MAEAPSSDTIMLVVVLLLQLGLPVLLLAATYLIGHAMEKRHYENIREREEQTRSVPAINFRTLPSGWTATRSGMVSGSVVISVDYFKRFLASLRALVGGRIKSYESLFDRGRREAMLRMKELAIGKGYDAIINVRLETSRLANAQRQGKGKEKDTIDEPAHVAGLTKYHGEELVKLLRQAAERVPLYWHRQR